MFAPIIFNFKNKKALVVGSGKTGIRRAGKLKDYGCDVTVIAKTFDKTFIEALSDYTFLRKAFEDSDLDGFEIVVAATDDKALNHHIVSLANKENILSNSVNFDSDETFSFPAVHQDEKVWLAVSTGGEFPSFAKEMLRLLSKSVQSKFMPRYRLLVEAKKTLEENNTSENKIKQILDRISKYKLSKLRRFVDNLIAPGKEVVRIGTRGSKLALRQTQEVIDRIKDDLPDGVFLPVIYKTTGDINSGRPFSELAPNAFSDTLITALKNNEVDFIVNSAKDVEFYTVRGGISPDLTTTFMPREDPGDTLILREEVDFKKPVTIGTSSKRRERQVSDIHPKTKIKPIRGNVDTRISKVLKGEYDGVVVAQAALNRLGITDEVLKQQGLKTEKLDTITAPLQGLLAITSKKDNDDVKFLLSHASDQTATLEAMTEIDVKMNLDPECKRGIGVRATVDVKNEVCDIDLYIPKDNGMTIVQTWEMGTFETFLAARDDMYEELSDVIALDE